MPAHTESQTEALAREHAFFRQLFEHTPGGVVILDNEDRVVDANPGFLRLFQYALEEVKGQHLNQLIVPESLWEEASENSRHAILGTRGDRFEREATRRRKDGSTVEVAVLATPIRLAKEQLGIYAIYLDITARRQAERALAREKEVAEVTLQAIGDGVIRTDADGRIEYLNPVAEMHTGWPLADAYGRFLTDVFDIVNEHTREPTPNPVTRCLREGRIVGLANHSVLRRRDGQELGVEDSAAPVLDRQGHVIGAVLVFRDVTERRRLQAEIAYRARHDSLTGLFNRNVLEQEIDKLVKDRRRRDRSHSLLYLDLDHFKLANDTHGHQAGDALLKQVASRLQKRLRKTDLFARMGGDEFGVLLRDCDVPSALALAESLITALKDKRFLWRDQAFRLGGSIGVVALDQHMRLRTQVLSAADEACYMAKEAGGNRIYLYQPTNSEIRRREADMLWVERLERAIEEDRLELYCQHIYRLEELPGVARRSELLVRLRDETDRLISPVAFVPAAERYGMIGQLDRWVCWKAFQCLKDWSRTRKNQELELLHVNLSGLTLSDPQFLSFLREKLEDQEWDGTRICFEITETVAINNLKQTDTFIKTVHDFGCRVALDDFGTGVSSFGYLRDLPVDYLKIDGSFVRNIATDSMHFAIVEAMHRIAQVARIPCIAEGVEKERSVSKLQEIGIPFGQGFALHCPEPWPSPGS